MLNRFPFFASLLLLLTVGSLAHAKANEVIGYWATPESIIVVKEVENTLSMKVVALLEPYYTEEDPFGPVGTKKRDAGNPDPSMRDRYIVGLELLSGYRREKKRWAGKIYDPETAQVYSSFMEVGRKGILKIRGYIGAPFFGRTQNLVPVSDCNEVVLLMLKANKNIPNNCIF